MFARFHAILAAAVLAFPAYASIHVWTGGAAGPQISNPANWSGGSPAGDSAAELVFPPASRQLVFNDLPALRITSLSILATGYTIGGNAITLLRGTIDDETNGPNTIAADLRISGETVIVTNTFEALIRTVGLTLSGSIGGSGSITKLGKGRAIFAGPSPNTYDGLTRVREGELQLAKPAGVNAVPGDVVATAGYLRTVSNEQIPDSATIDVGFGAAFGGVETVGPLILHPGSRIGTNVGYNESLPNSGTVILGGDITLFADSGSTLEATIASHLVLPATRTITGASTQLRLFDVTGDGGLVLRSTSTVVPIVVDATYTGPTRVEGARVALTNPATDVTVRSGVFEGKVRSVHAEGGTVASSQTTGELRLESGSALTSRLTTTSIVSAGPVLLGGARLDVNFDAPRQLGKTHLLLRNDGASPVGGTFANLPEGGLIGDSLRISYSGGDGNDVTLTQVGKYATKVDVSSSKQQPAFDEPVTITARVQDDIAAEIPTGTMTFSIGDAVLATLPLADAAASLTTALPGGFTRITATYSGDAIFKGSSGTTAITATPPRPVITSIEPEEVEAGTRVTVTIHGSGFVAGSVVQFQSLFDTPARFVSPTEMQVTLDIPDRLGLQLLRIEVRQPISGAVSNAAILRAVSRLAPSELTFDAQNITAPVTPAATSVWFLVARRLLPPTTDAQAIVTVDSEITGTARLRYPSVLQTQGVYTMTDLATGRLRAGSPTAYRPRQSPFPENAFLRDLSGRFSHVVMPSTAFGHYLLVRPGVGAWKAMSFADGGADDRDGAVNDLLFFDLNAMTPVGDSPAPPDGLENGDLFIGIGPNGERWFADRVDEHLRGSGGLGAVSFATTVARLYNEKDGFARITLIRTVSADGTASVRYATADGSARAGIHYQAVAGTVTFAPGEIVKTISVPLLDDAFFSGSDPSFKVVLSDPVGATIAGPAESTIRVHDDEPLPVISISDAQVQEGDTLGQHARMRVTLTGATRLAATATWYWWRPFAGPVTGGTVVFQPGETEKTIEVPFDGNASANEDTGVEVGIMFFPENATTTGIPAKLSIIDDDPVELVVLDAAAEETKGQIALTVRPLIFGFKKVSVSYRTVDGTAKAGTDYVAATGTLHFDFGLDPQEIRILIKRDPSSDEDRWFRVELFDARGATIRRSSAVATILNHAPLPVLTIAPVTVDEGNSGTTTATFNLELSIASVAPVRVIYVTNDDSARTPADYIMTSGDLTFAPGERSKVVTVEIKGDTEVEADELFFLRVYATGVLSYLSRIPCTIRNDD